MAPQRPSKKNKVQAGGVNKKPSDTTTVVGRTLQSASSPLNMIPPESSAKAATQAQAEKGPFPFMALPPELRNEIYSYLLPRDTSVEVRVVDPDECSQLLKEKTIGRTSFAMHKEEKGEFDGDAIHSRRSYKVDHVTYAMKQGELLNSLSILGVSRQIRMETLGLFYGRNTFHFENWRTLKPFLVDRSPEAMGLTESLSISMILEKENKAGRCERYVDNRHEWGKALQVIGKLPKWRLKNLFIHMEAEHWDFNMTYVQGHTGCYADNITRLLPRSFGRTISNLDKLGVQFHWENRPRPSYIGLPRVVPPPTAEDLEEADEVLWNHLAPKLLQKVKGRSHKGPELLDRRIIPDQRELIERLQGT